MNGERIRGQEQGSEISTDIPIQNKADHRRIIQASNRQALANWMLEGLVKAAKT